MSGQMIFFAMGFSGGCVGVGCHIVEFCGSVMRTLGHDVLLVGSMQTRRQSPRNNLSMFA
jgi:hypothetical protein